MNVKFPYHWKFQSRYHQVKKISYTLVSPIIHDGAEMFLMPAQTFGGAVMTKISLKLVILQNVYILERVTNKKQK